jgi:hypothetical protein
MVMKLLGWKISMSEDKRFPFGVEFQMLGAVIDLSKCRQGVAQVRNKPSRMADIGAMVEDLCQRDSIPLPLIIVVFTDGACENGGEDITYGATLFDPETGKSLMFGDAIPDCWVIKWKAGGKKQLICQAEIFPVLVSKATWKEELEHRAILWFTDQNAALSAVIRSFSPVIENYELNSSTPILTSSCSPCLGTHGCHPNRALVTTRQG